jgi:glycosyl hydrolase family 28
MLLKKYIIVAIILINSNFLLAKDYPASLFNIYSDGVTLNTRSIQFAIDYIHQQGGGRLVFDVGRFLTGSIHLKSGVILHLQEGAVLLGTLNPFDYDRKNFTALIFAHDQENIAITGKGVIDGQGRQVARNVAGNVHKGLVKDAFRNDRPEAEIRPMLIYFRSSKNIRIKGITLRNAASWVQTYDQCKNVQLDSVYVDSKAFWNNDGIDIVDSDSVAVTNSFIDASDDGICLKSHDAAQVCQNIFIRNCTIRSSANGIKFGTASYGGFRNIQILRIKVFDTYRSAIAVEAVDGGFIEGVQADSIEAYNTGNAFFLRIGQRVTGKKSRLENVRFSNIYVEISAAKPDAGYEYEGPIEDMPRNISPASIAGLPNAYILNINLKNIEIKYPGGGNPLFAKISTDELDKVPEKPESYPEFSKFGELPAWGLYVRHANEISVTNLRLSCHKKDYRAAIVLDDVHDSQFFSTDIKEPGNKKGIYMNKCTGVIIK